MKRLLTLLALTCAAAAAFGATLNPVQLLNPTGSTSGQAIVSTGPSTAPAWGNVTATALGAQAANTVVANFTGSSASPTAFSMPSCTGATNALGYTSGTGIVCNSAVNAATLGGATFASPGPVGTTVSSAGAFTTLNAAGNDALNYTTTNALSLPSASVVTVTTFTKQFDRVNTNFNASTGVFTAPATGIYQVCWNFVLNNAANVVGSRLLVAIQLNASTVTGAGGQSWMQSSNTFAWGFGSCTLVSATAAQALTVVVTQNSGATRTLDGTTSNWISINRVP